MSPRAAKSKVSDTPQRIYSWRANFDQNSLGVINTSSPTREEQKTKTTRGQNIIVTARNWIWPGTELNWLPKHDKPLIQLNLSIVLIPLLKFPLPGDRKHPLHPKQNTTMAFPAFGVKTKCLGLRCFALKTANVYMQMCVLAANGEALERAVGGRRPGGRPTPNKDNSPLWVRALVDSDASADAGRVSVGRCARRWLALAAALFRESSTQQRRRRRKTTHRPSDPQGACVRAKLIKSRRRSTLSAAYRTPASCIQHALGTGVVLVEFCVALSSCAPEWVRRSFEASAADSIMAILWHISNSQTRQRYKCMPR